MMPKIDFYALFRTPSPTGPGKGDDDNLLFLAVVLTLVASIAWMFLGQAAFAQSTKIPGVDASGQLEAAGTLLKIIDTGLFKWGARIFAGICIMSSGWALKEQRFGIAIICVIGAIIFGTAPTWVKNIFSIGGGEGVFGSLSVSTSVELALHSIRNVGDFLHA